MKKTPSEMLGESYEVFGTTVTFNLAGTEFESTMALLDPESGDYAWLVYAMIETLYRPVRELNPLDAPDNITVVKRPLIGVGADKVAQNYDISAKLKVLPGSLRLIQDVDT